MTDTTQRPEWACLLCAPPRDVGRWRPADQGYRTCNRCLEGMRDRLKDVTRRYLMLNPRPGASGDWGRGAPGFRSRPPASLHILCMTDVRSSPLARTWRGGDGRIHHEPERPPLSVYGVLHEFCLAVAEARHMTTPTAPDVPAAAQWLDAQLDWISRQDGVTVLDTALRELQAQLKPVTGDPGRKRVGTCPNTLDEGETTRQCGAALFAPLKGDIIQCQACGRKWERPEWEKLGKMLQVVAEEAA